MLTSRFDKLGYQIPTTSPNQKPEAPRSPKRYHDDIDAHGIETADRSLAKRICRVSLDSADSSPTSREQLGGKGMFLQRMVEIGLPVPPFKCATTKVVNALEQHPLNTVRIARNLPEIELKLKAETSLAEIKQHLQTLPPSEQAKRDKWLAGLTQFVASDDFYEQVKDSQAARDIRALRAQLGEPSTPVIVRSSGINEDNYGDAQAGKYLSEVQGEDDVLRTCLNVMASSYRPEVCAGGAPQPMALILQQCIDCQYGGVAMSYQSLQDDTIRVEYTSGQPKGAVAGLYGTTPHRIDIPTQGGADCAQYFPGTVSSHFVLRKNSTNSGYTETEIGDVGTQSDGDRQRLTYDQISSITWMVRLLEERLWCPTEIEFGIDHLGQVFVLQVRPITRLPGGMDFAMPPPAPEETLASGIGVSEGYCTGPLWLANKQGLTNSQAVDTMPEGVIVVAQHGEEWMLEPDVLKRAAGFVFATGGTNDHVAITLRQAEKPCLLAGDQYQALATHNDEQATLAYARFNGTSGAFVVTGDLTGRLASHRCLSSAISGVPSAQAAVSPDDFSPPEGTFSQVATAYRWLTDQNTRLLALFAPGGGLDCLANPIKLSMSAQRAEIMAVTQDNVNLLIHGAQAMLDGYQVFLQLAGDSCSRELKSLQHELAQLIPRFETLKQNIKPVLESVALPMKAGEEVQVSTRRFRPWIENCHELHRCLQKFCPCMANRVQSVHDLIYVLHRGFVKALAPVTLASGQGKVSQSRGTTYFDYTSPECAAGLLSPSCKTAIEKLNFPVTVASMDDALIVNLHLGNHQSLIELLEQAEGVKRRTLRLTFSDLFSRPDGSDNPGALKRMWFLAQLFKEIELDKNAGGMKLSCNAEAGKITVECPKMISREAMHEAFEKLVSVLSELRDVDINLVETSLFEEDKWSFNLLAQRLGSDFSEADRLAFEQCLFSLAYKDSRTFYYYKLLDKHFQQFIDYAGQLSKAGDNPREMLMSGEIGEETSHKLLNHLFILKPAIATPILEHMYPHLQNQYFVTKPFWSNHPKFLIEPGRPLSEDKEKVKSVLLECGLKYASQQVRNDKDLVLPIIAAHPDDLKYVSEELKNDKDVVLAAVRQKGGLLGHAGWEAKDNVEVVMAAIANNTDALEFASERVRGVKSVIEMAVTDSIYYLKFASERLLRDRDFLLKLIKDDHRAYTYASRWLKHSRKFNDAAIKVNPMVSEYVKRFYKEMRYGYKYKNPF